MTTSYAFQNYEPERMARASSKNIDISTKKGVEVCNFIRGKNLQIAKKYLEEVADFKRPVPIRRFTEGAGHKHGVGAAKYPVNCSKELLVLLKSVEANAQEKGLNTSNLAIIHICVNRASKPYHHGRKSRRQMKRSHIEVVVAERATPKKEEKKKQKTAKKSETK